jgi:hypothetical protein
MPLPEIPGYGKKVRISEERLELRDQIRLYRNGAQGLSRGPAN